MFTPREIILHHSLTKDGQTVSWQAIRRFHIETNGWADIGYHVGLELINGEYEVLIGRPLDVVGAHTVGHNTTGIGICCVGNFDVDQVPEKMLKKLLETMRWVMKACEISSDAIYGHGKFAQKSCPGKNFPMKRIIDTLKKEGL